MRNLNYKPLVTSTFLKMRSQQTVLLCPACNTEIGLTELLERRGYVGCINCVR